MKDVRKLMLGFTLVELLIVITLIAILSVAVIATINPIEQANKARDARYKNDAAELLSAFERYYASQDKYPWNVTDYDENVGSTIAPGVVVAMSSIDKRLGVVKNPAGANGVLVETFEIKGSFAGKSQFQAGPPAPGATEMMYVYTDGSLNTFVCYCPKAVSGRIGTAATGLKCMKGTFTSATSGIGTTVADIGTGNIDGKDCIVPVSGTVVGGAQNTNFCNVGYVDGSGDYVANMQCVPDGNVKMN